MNSILVSVFVVGFVLFAKRLCEWYLLRDVPGPFLASISDVWRYCHQRRGTFREKLLELHKEHGPMVRYGVNAVSFSDPNAVRTIYASRTSFPAVSLSR
jgi:hypothetical protein